MAKSPIGLNPNTKTGKINLMLIEIIKESHDGIIWADLARKLEAALPEAHPKTTNGLIWKLAENFPDQIERTQDKRFRSKS